jgi:hypothetical protein
MAFRLLLDENTAAGLSSGSAYQQGISDFDPGAPDVETGILLPWTMGPTVSWLDYQCWIEVELDAGMALHKPLPSVVAVDTLGSFAPDDIAMAQEDQEGVNLTSQGGYADVLQKMASSLYRFKLRGWGVRAGYKVPVPKLITIANVDATPAERQWSSGNRIVGNFSAVPIWRCDWDLWYYVALPPNGDEVPPSNWSEHIGDDTQLPDGMQVPYSWPDQNSVQQPPGGQ